MAYVTLNVILELLEVKYYHAGIIYVLWNRTQSTDK